MFIKEKGLFFIGLGCYINMVVDVLLLWDVNVVLVKLFKKIFLKEIYFFLRVYVFMWYNFVCKSWIFDKILYKYINKLRL